MAVGWDLFTNIYLSHCITIALATNIGYRDQDPLILTLSSETVAVWVESAYNDHL